MWRAITLSCVLMLGLASPVIATPFNIVTPGTWQAVTGPSESGTNPWDNPSWDGPLANIGYKVDLGGYEWLQGPFTISGVTWGPENIIQTALPNGFLTVLSSGELTYNNTIGNVFNSNGDGAVNFWLLRELGLGRGLLIVEDLPQGFGTTDNDGDKWWRWDAIEDPPNVPEPASLTLFGTGLFFAARRLRKG